MQYTLCVVDFALALRGAAPLIHHGLGMVALFTRQLGHRLYHPARLPLHQGYH
jgi:hypothetical protein